MTYLVGSSALAGSDCLTGFVLGRGFRTLGAAALDV